MWDGITPVSEGYDPIVAESDSPVEVLVTNAGPGTIVVKAWDEPRPDPGDAPKSMELRPGATRFIVGKLVRLGASDSMREEGPPVVPRTERKDFAAAGWQVTRRSSWRP